MINECGNYDLDIIFNIASQGIDWLTVRQLSLFLNIFLIQLIWLLSYISTCILMKGIRTNIAGRFLTAFLISVLLNIVNTIQY